MFSSKKMVNNLKESGLDKDIYIWACDYIKDIIDDFHGYSTDGADLAYRLTETPNYNGKYEEDSFKFIGDHIKEAAKEFDYQSKELGCVTNPFKDPDGFVVCWLIHAVECVLNNIPVVSENWNGMLDITPEVINEIKEYLY